MIVSVLKFMDMFQCRLKKILHTIIYSNLKNTSDWNLYYDNFLNSIDSREFRNEQFCNFAILQSHNFFHFRFLDFVVS